MALDDIQLDIIISLQGDSNIRRATQALQSAGRAADTVRKNADAVSMSNLRSIKSWDDLTQALGDVERKYDAVFRAGVHMTEMGHGLLDVSRRIVDTALDTVRAYEGYDLMLRRGATALNANAEWQGKLDQAIQDTATAVGLLSPEEIAEGYYIWGAAAGVVVDSQKELDDITNVVRDTMIATAMAGGTLEGNLNGVYGVLSQFNLPASEATDVVHDLALMTERTAAQFPDLLNSFSYAGPLMESIGITFQDVTSILGLLADAGQKGSRAGRGLSMVIEGMSAPSAVAKDALDGVVQATHGLNAEWSDVVFPKGEFVGMRDMVIELAKGLDDATDAERGRFYAQAFTNNATRALIPLIEDQIDLNREAAASGKDVTSVLDQQKYSLEGAGDFWETMRSQALGSITAIRTRLENSFFPILQSVAKEIMNSAEPVINFLGEMADNIADFVDQNPELVRTAIHFAGITAAAAGAAGVLFTFGGALLYLIGNLGVFLQGIGRVLTPFASLGVVIGLVVAAIVDNVNDIQGAATQFWTSFQNLVSHIVGDGSTFSDIWKEMWDGIRDAVNGAVSIVADVLRTLSDWMDTLAQNKAFTDFMRGLLGVFVRFRGAITAFAVASGGLWAAGRAIAFTTGVLKVLSGYAFVAGLVRSLATAFMVFRAAVAVGGISAGLQALAALMGGPVLLSIVSVMTALSPLILAVGAVVAVGAALFLAWQNNWFGIRDIVGNVVNWITGTLFPAIGAFVQGVIQWFADLFSNIGTIAGNIGAFIAAIPGQIMDFLAQVAEAIGGFLASIPGAMVDALAWVWENWAYILGLIVGNILGFTLRVLFEIGKFLVSLIATFIDWLTKLPGLWWDIFTGVWGFILGWFLKLVPAIAGWLADIVGSFVTWLSQLPGKIAAWFGQMWTNISTWFVTNIPKIAAKAGELITGIVDWFIKLPGRVAFQLGIWLGDLKDFFAELPGKLWDSIVAIGTAIIEGIWRGIQNLGGWLWDKFSDFFNGLVDGVKGWLGIASPSKVFAEIGTNMARGISVGINGDDSAMRSMRNYTDSLIGIAENASFSAGGLIADAVGAGDISVSSDGRQVLRVELDLTSSDGSYSDATLEQLKAALTGSDLVRSLERMAETD